MLMRYIAIILLLSVWPARTAFAQCVNSATPNCGVYSTCFAKYCNCTGSPSEYFISYGKNYCERFLGNVNFSAAGKKWRDSTLVCLQETIVPHLKITDPPQACDCPQMRKTALDSHVACYTSAANSICNLPGGDIDEIYKIVKLKDVFSKEGWGTMKQITAVCKVSANSEPRRATWGAINALLNTY